MTDQLNTGVWIVAETADGEIGGMSLELLGAALPLADALGEEVGALLIGHDVASLADKMIAHGAQQVVIAEHPGLAKFSSDVYAKVLGGFIGSHLPRVLLLGHSAWGRDLLGRASVRLGVSAVVDCTALAVENDRLTCTRPIFGGTMLTRSTFRGTTGLATIRSKAFEKSPQVPGRQGKKRTLPVDPTWLTPRTEVVDIIRDEAVSISLADAEIIVSGGRGIGAAEKFEIVERLAVEMGAAVGASRAVVDAGWRPHKEQVGQTGRTVSPKLYIACGISGAIQHLVGMRTSSTIVAINSDIEAPIMKIANLAIVGDVFEVIPAVIEELRKLKATAAT